MILVASIWLASSQNSCHQTIMLCHLGTGGVSENPARSASVLMAAAAHSDASSSLQLSFFVNRLTSPACQPETLKCQILIQPLTSCAGATGARKRSRKWPASIFRTEQHSWSLQNLENCGTTILTLRDLVTLIHNVYGELRNHCANKVSFAVFASTKSQQRGVVRSAEYVVGLAIHAGYGYQALLFPR